MRAEELVFLYRVEAGFGLCFHVFSCRSTRGVYRLTLSLGRRALRRGRRARQVMGFRAQVSASPMIRASKSL